MTSRPSSLRDYVQHKATCAKWDYDNKGRQVELRQDINCTCGLAALLSQPAASSSLRALEQINQLARDIGTVIDVSGRRTIFNSERDADEHKAMRKMLKDWRARLHQLESLLALDGTTPQEKEAMAVIVRLCGDDPGKSLVQRIEAELTDYMSVLEEVSAVYDNITRGRISKPNTLRHHVIDCVNELQQEAVDEAVKEAEAPLALPVIAPQEKCQHVNQRDTGEHMQCLDCGFRWWRNASSATAATKVWVAFNGQEQLIGVYATEELARENTKYYAECPVKGAPVIAERETEK